MRALQRALREQDAVIGEDADRIAPDPREAAHQGRAVQLFELIQFAVVDDAGDDLAHLVRPANSGRDHAVDLLGRVTRLVRRLNNERYRLDSIEITDDTAGDAER